MNLLFFSLMIIVGWWLGWSVLSWGWPASKDAHHSAWLAACLSVGIGLGCTSITTFVSVVIANGSQAALTLLIECLALFCLYALRIFRKRPASLSLPRLRLSRPSFLATLFWGVFVLANVVFFLRSLENPHGESDAWTFWNARARLFFRSTGQWAEVFLQQEWSFPSYPLQTSMNVLRLWSAIGRETFASPILIAWLFTFATAGILVLALRQFRGNAQGYIGGLILLSTPYFLKHGAAQYADVPLGFYILAVFVLINLSDQEQMPVGGFWKLIGLTIGFAAWTKNEGWLLLISVLTARVLIRVIRREWRHFWREMLAFSEGLLPLILWFLCYWNAWTPLRPVSESQGLALLFAKLTDVARYEIIAKAFARTLIEPYSLVYSTPILILVVYGVFMGLSSRQSARPGVLTTGLSICLMFSGYFLVYVITPHDLTWHLATSLHRLFLQLWPSVIFALLLLIAAPEERCSLSHS